MASAAILRRGGRFPTWGSGFRGRRRQGVWAPALAERPGRGARVPYGPRMHAPRSRPRRQSGGLPSAGSAEALVATTPVPAIMGGRSERVAATSSARGRRASSPSRPLAAGRSIRQFTQFCQSLIRSPRAKCFRRDGIRLYCSLWGQERKHGHDERPPTILRGPAKARRAARRHRARLRSGRLDTGLGRLFRHAVSSDAQDEAGEDNRRIENGAASP